MHASVWYNTTRDEQGRPLGMLDLGRHGAVLDGHDFMFVAELKRSDWPSHADAAEAVWRLMNVVDGTELPVSLRVRSMSIGDVVVFDDGVAMVARSFGFEPVDFPTG